MAGLLESFYMGGFECATHRRRDRAVGGRDCGGDWGDSVAFREVRVFVGGFATLTGTCLLEVWFRSL